MLRSVVLLSVAGLQSVQADCPQGITCSQIKANDLTFDCHVAGDNGKSGDVLLLHGFPERASMYDELMRQLASKGFRSVACDQRGYSPGASPDGVENYMYNLLRDDVFAVAAAAGFEKFHLVGHDHGSALGWYTAGSAKGKQSLLSYTGMSVPHTDAFSAGLFGPDADEQQQVASQYFSMFVLNNSATLDFDFWYHAMGSSAGFKSATEFQKALWWYNGAMSLGVLAQPPQFTAWELTTKGDLAMASLREVFGVNPDLAKDGAAQTTAAGDISVPSLFVCGSTDTALLCTRPFAKKSESYCKGGYTYLEVNCGHDVLSCSSSAETQKVIAGVIAHVTSANTNLMLV